MTVSSQVAWTQIWYITQHANDDLSLKGIKACIGINCLVSFCSLLCTLPPSLSSLSPQASLVRPEMLLLMASLDMEDSCWEQRLRTGRWVGMAGGQGQGDVL